MQKIKLLGFQTYQAKNGTKSAEIHFMVLDEPMRCKEGFSAQGYKVGSARIQDKGVPLYINAEYDTVIKFGEFNGEQYWRIDGLILSKK